MFTISRIELNIKKFFLNRKNQSERERERERGRERDRKVLATELREEGTWREELRGEREEERRDREREREREREQQRENRTAASKNEVVGLSCALLGVD